MASNPDPDTILRPINGPARPLSNFLTTFHLVLIVVDPYTHESAWIIETGGRILETFQGADCRCGWLVAGDAEDCKAFLGPWSDRFTTFADADRALIKSLQLTQLPAIVHLGMDATIISEAEGWHPAQWRAVTDNAARLLQWKGPRLPGTKDPAPYDGTAATG